MTLQPYREVCDISQLPAPDGTGYIARYVFQYIDFNQVPQYVAAGHRFTDCCFLGCDIPTAMDGQIGNTCLVFPRMGRVYNVFRARLYDGESLYAGYDPEHEESFESCFDARVYADYQEKGKECDDIRETLGRTLHDRAMSGAMREFLNRFDERQVVAIMGGHAQFRTDEGYRKVALISKTLTENGKLMASGGGPGAMEATHLGAWMAGRSLEEFEDALEILSVAPTFRDEGWLRTAFEVRKKYPQNKYHSLGIPTWFYGHEPATPFATHIAKYFYNSVREDTLLAIAKGGIIYSPGSAGTIQEIFQDAAQNHYQTFGAPSPMVFLGKEFFTREIPIYTLLEDLMARGKYKNLLISITDDPQEAIDTMLSFPEKDATAEC
ncbi:MAG: LOG family protein [Bacteroidales bacterium]|nr:LOG family protein [Bacteroidales bacterium]